MKKAILLLSVLVVVVGAGCTSSVGFGDDEDGVGVKTTVAKDGKILALEPTDGEGRVEHQR